MPDPAPPETNPDAPAPPKRPARRWHALLGWLLTAVLLGGLLWAVPLREVWQAMLRANPWLLGLAMAPVLVNLWLRGVRWALLFRPHYPVSGRAALGPALIGLGLNAVLPGRVGDIARISLGAQKFGTSLPFTASTIIGERLLDVLVVLTLLGGSMLLLPPVDASLTIEAFGTRLSAATLASLGKKLGVLCLVLIALAALLTRPAFPTLLARMLARLPRIGPTVGDWAQRILGEFGRGFGAFSKPSVFAPAVLATLVIWLTFAAMNLAVAAAIPGIELSFLQALVVTSISMTVSFLPSAPGAWGVYEAGMLLALGLVAVLPAPGVGLAFALASHLCSYLPVVILGAVASLRARPFARPPER